MFAHSSWDCKYHVVFVPKRRRKVLFGQARRKLGEVFHALARQKECQFIKVGQRFKFTVVRSTDGKVCREGKVTDVTLLP